MKLAGHLRVRLVACIALAGAFGLGGVLVSFLLASRGPWNSLRWTLREPYQDIVLIVPLISVATLLIWFVSGRSLRRLVAITRQANAVGAQTPNMRLSTAELPAEVLPLIESVNGALDRLAKAYSAEQRFITDAAHQLRTPLTGLSLRLQRAKIGGTADWDGLIGEVHALDDLIGCLLRLARHESVHRGEIGNGGLSHVDLALLGRQAATIVLPLAEAAGRTIEVVCLESAWTRGDARSIKELLINLLENAVHHGRGAISLRVELQRADGMEPYWHIRVLDQGPGIAPDLWNTAFDRFSKGESDSAGHGLGLAIVREIALAHGGAAILSEGPRRHVIVELPQGHPAMARSSYKATGMNALGAGQLQAPNAILD